MLRVKIVDSRERRGEVSQSSQRQAVDEPNDCKAPSPSGPAEECAVREVHRSNTRAALTIVKLALPLLFTLTGRVTSSSPFLSAKSRWACCGNTGSPEAMSTMVNVSLRVVASPRLIGDGSGAGSFRLHIACQRIILISQE